ncbi:MAG: CPBP family intramembrane metalloprotease [Ruminococcaceae bacterium]|nr:CPBP family intramembrane metalloprotease [Oscillospiraceae bacterium]
MTKTILFPTARERSWGWRYMLFSLFFLPSLLQLLFSAVGVSLNTTWLNLAYFSFNFLGILVINRHFLPNTVKDAAHRLLPVLLTAAVSFCVYWVANLALSWLIRLINPAHFNSNDQGIAAIAREQYLLTAVCVVFLVPLTEECLYRGAVFGSLYRKSKLAAYLVSTALFSLVHIDGWFGVTDIATLALSFLQYIPAGLCLAAAYEISGSIAAPILIHMAVNAIGILAMR